MNRLTWDEYALRLADTASLRSEDPYQKVGSCALDEQNRVLALGYNGLAAGKKIDSKDKFWEDRDARRPFVIHAEANCLSMVEAGRCQTLATTLLPCSYCASMIAAYRIPRVVYREEYDKDLKAHEIFNFYGIDLIKL